MRYSPGMAQFYDAAPWPDDAVEISAQLHDDLMLCVSHGGSIEAGADGLPVPVYPAATLDGLRQQTYAQIDAWRETAIATGTVDYNGHTFQADRVSSANITSALVAVGAGISLPPGFVWRTADNVNVPFSPGDLVALGGLALTAVNEAYAKAWALKAQAAVADAPTILSITWS
jgi:hypothetical protein